MTLSLSQLHSEEMRVPWGLGQMLRGVGRWVGVSGQCRRQQAPG